VLLDACAVAATAQDFDITAAQLGSFENRLDVLQALFGLLLDRVAGQSTRRRIGCALTGDENQPLESHAGRVGADGARKIGRVRGGRGSRVRHGAHASRFVTCATHERVRFGDYDLGECIGTGGMAEVWLARHRRSRASVIVKRLLPHVTNPDVAELFARESRIAMTLEHPNIVRTLDAGTLDGVPWLATEHVDRGDLRAFMQSWLTKQRVAPPVALTAVVIGDVARALAYAHAHGIIHRDVAPSNVLLGRNGAVKLVDFGIAKVAYESVSRSLSTARGKPGYVAPEVLEGEPSDFRVDVFGLGVTLHEMLVGRRLFYARTPFETLARTLRCEVEAPSKLNPDVPEAIDACCLSALARDPEERLADASQIAHVLDAFVANGRALLVASLGA